MSDFHPMMSYSQLTYNFKASQVSTPVFLHDNAGLVHGNLTPDAVFVNAKVGMLYKTLDLC